MNSKSISALVLSISIVCFPIVNSGASRHQQLETYDQHIKKGKLALEKRDYAEAYWELESARIKEPDNPEPYTLVARLRSEEGRYEEALAKIEQGLSLIPYSGMLHYAMADLLYRTGKTSKAAIEAETAYKLGYRSSDLYLLMSAMKLPGADDPAWAKLSLEELQKRRQQRLDEALAWHEETLRSLAANDPAAPALRQRIEIIKMLRQGMLDEKDPSYKRPTAKNSPRPDYTEDARQHKVCGTVLLAVYVKETGEVGEIAVINRLGYGLDEQAVKAAKKMEFSPATKNGKPVVSIPTVRVQFCML